MQQKEFNTILVVGPAGTHLTKFISMIIPFFKKVVVISDKPCELDQVSTVKVDFHYSLKNYFATTSIISEQIKTLNPQFIHIHQLSSNAFYAVRACRKNNFTNIISTAWGTDVLVTPDKSKILNLILKYVLKHSKAITADANFMFESINKRVLNLTKFQEKILFGIELKPILFQKEDIIYSNRLHNPLYRIDKIIIAFSKFIKHPENNHYKLVIGATGSQTQNLKQLVSDLELTSKVDFVGWINQEKNTEYFQKAKIYVSIPESDGTSVSLLEAMYYGCVPIVSNLPANNEWIKNGVNGIIVNDVDEDFIVSTFKNIELGLEHNFNIIKEQGTFDIAKEKYLDLYKRVLNHAN